MEASTVGWREWAHLPNLDIGPIKAKMDTGARTTALHAHNIEVCNGMVEFKVHTIQGRDDFSIAAKAALVEMRDVRDSGGTTTTRPIIESDLALGPTIARAEISLVDRMDMKFRLLVGRTALASRYLVDSNAEYLHGVPAAVHNWSPP